MRVNVAEQGLSAIYKYYKTTTKNPVDSKTFKKVAYLFLQKSMQAILEGHNYRMPNRLGFIRIQKKEINYEKLHFDYHHYNTTGQKAWHLNDHSDGYRGKFHWQKSACLVKGKMPYSYVPPRHSKRSLAKIFKSEGGHKRFPTEKY